jgi:biopolymer transport protein ExbB
VLGAAVQALKTSPEKVEKAVNDAAQLEMYSLKKNLWIFAVIASMAPLIGLLGTVIGLVQAFREVALSGLGSGARLAPGIYEALVCTVGGLSVAIPAMAIYYSVGARIDHYVFELDRLAVGLVQGYPSRERPHPPPLVAPKGR